MKWFYRCCVVIFLITFITTMTMLGGCASAPTATGTFCAESIEGINEISSGQTEPGTGKIQVVIPFEQDGSLAEKYSFSVGDNFYFLQLTINGFTLAQCDADGRIVQTVRLTPTPPPEGDTDYSDDALIGVRELEGGMLIKADRHAYKLDTEMNVIKDIRMPHEVIARRQMSPCLYDVPDDLSGVLYFDEGVMMNELGRTVETGTPRGIVWHDPENGESRMIFQAEEGVSYSELCFIPESEEIVALAYNENQTFEEKKLVRINLRDKVAVPLGISMVNDSQMRFTGYNMLFSSAQMEEAEKRTVSGVYELESNRFYVLPEEIGGLNVESSAVSDGKLYTVADGSVFVFALSKENPVLASLGLRLADENGKICSVNKAGTLCVEYYNKERPTESVYVLQQAQ